MAGDRGAERPDRRQVVEDPERAAVGAQHEVVSLDDQVVNRDGRQVELERLPALAVIGREDHAPLGSRVEHALSSSGLRERRGAGRPGAASRREQRPGLAVVARPVEVGMHIVEHVGVDDEVGRRRVERRRLDHLDRAPLRQPGQVLGDVGPGLAAVASHVDEAVVRADPDQALLLGRFGDRRDRAVVLRGRVVAGDRTAGPLLPAACRCGSGRR